MMRRLRQQNQAESSLAMCSQRTASGSSDARAAAVTHTGTIARGLLIDKWNARSETAAMAIGLRVEYCASCNYLPRTLWMLGEILSEIQGEVRDVSVVPGDRGIFDWFVDGEVVFSKGEQGRFPDLEELKEAIYAKLD